MKTLNSPASPRSYNRQSTFAKATVDAVVEFLHRSPHVLRLRNNERWRQ
ncbi:hypothetical protein [uncultured Roseivirga sp.]